MFESLLHGCEARPVEIQISPQTQTLSSQEEVIFSFCDFDLKLNVHQDRSTLFRGFLGNKGVV